jgi:hypothetical protein
MELLSLHVEAAIQHLIEDGTLAGLGNDPLIGTTHVGRGGPRAGEPGHADGGIGSHSAG